MPRLVPFALALVLCGAPLGGCGIADVADVLSQGKGGGSGGAGSGDGSLPSSMSGQELDAARTVFAMVNDERAKAGVAPLLWSDAASEVAFDHSLDMQVRGYVEHVDPDGLSPGDRLRRAGIAWTRSGENIGSGYPSASAMMDGWMDSAGHRANVLDPLFTHVGVGVRAGGGGGPWWTQAFYRP